MVQRYRRKVSPKGSYQPGQGYDAARTRSPAKIRGGDEETSGPFRRVRRSERQVLSLRGTTEADRTNAGRKRRRVEPKKQNHDAETRSARHHRSPDSSAAHKLLHSKLGTENRNCGHPRRLAANNHTTNLLPISCTKKIFRPAGQPTADEHVTEPTSFIESVYHTKHFQRIIVSFVETARLVGVHNFIWCSYSCCIYTDNIRRSLS